jgi:hypothetical protein
MKLNVYGGQNGSDDQEEGREHRDHANLEGDFDHAGDTYANLYGTPHGDHARLSLFDREKFHRALRCVWGRVV